MKTIKEKDADKLAKYMFAEYLKQITPSYKDLDKVVAKLITLLGETKIALLKKIEASVKDIPANFKGIQQSFDILEDRLGDLDLADARLEQQIDSLINIFNKELARIEQLIPALPEPIDLSGIEEAIEELKNFKQLSPEEIRDHLELLQGDERLDKKAIKGIEEIEADIKELKSKKTQGVMNGGVIGRDFIKDIDLSSQFNGVTKTFNIQAVWNIISVSLQSYPYGALRKGIDYTWTPTSITFTDTIDASTQLAEGQACVLTVVIG